MTNALRLFPMTSLSGVAYLPSVWVPSVVFLEDMNIVLITAFRNNCEGLFQVQSWTLGRQAKTRVRPISSRDNLCLSLSFSFTALHCKIGVQLCSFLLQFVVPSQDAESRLSRVLSIERLNRSTKVEIGRAHV